MTLYEILTNTVYYGNVLIYHRNAYDQCMKIFQGIVYEARQDENAWNYLMQEVDQWICGNEWTLIYVKSYYYNDRLDRAFKSSRDVEMELSELN